LQLQRRISLSAFSCARGFCGKPTSAKYRPEYRSGTMITERQIDQTYSDLRSTCDGVREDYFGLLYLEREHSVPREKALNQVAFGGHDYGIDGFHFDEQRRNLYLFQFKYSDSHGQFKGSLEKLIENGVERVFLTPNKDDAKNPF